MATSTIRVRSEYDPSTLKVSLVGSLRSSSFLVLGQPSIPRQPNKRAFCYPAARLHGEPVATSALARAGGVAGIFSVTTIESARRRGIGKAVMMAPLLDARDNGYAVGVLQASEMGYSVYASMGFTEQFRFHDYLYRPN